MADSTNSVRTLLKATYVPLLLPAASSEEKPTGAPASPQPNVLMKVAYLRALNIRPAEMERLRKARTLSELRLSASDVPPAQHAARQPQPLLEVAHAVTTNLSPSVMRVHGPLLATATAASLEALGRELCKVRRERAADAGRSINELLQAYAEARQISCVEAAHTLRALQWASQQKHQAWCRLLHLAREQTTVGILADPSAASFAIAALPHKLLADATSAETLVDEFLLQFSFQPVGRLHLERLEMTPVGIETGELVYSVPLTPKESVNITHREWSETTTTFETLVSDSFEGFSEQGVTEKSDVATATSAETKHSSAFDVNGQVSFAYNGSPYSLTASTAVAYATKAEDANSVKDSHAHALAVTRTASARTRKEHKQSFRVSSVAGAENLSVRTLTNPSDSQTMRADYFRMMRRWQVDLIRYGLRMTYDLVIPNPGFALAAKVSELAYLKKVLAGEHTFALDPTSIGAANYQLLSQEHGVSLEPPPQPPGDLQQTAPLTKTDNAWQFASMQFNVPDEYQLSAARVWAKYSYNGDGVKGLWFGVLDAPFQPEKTSTGGGQVDVAEYDSDHPAIDPNGAFSHSLEGRSGQINIEYMWYHVDAGEVMVRLQLAPKPATFVAWQLKCWDVLRQANAAQYALATQKARERADQLHKEIEDYDSLTLRRMEREEIMRLVLVWIFGPSFQLVPSLFEQLAFPGTSPPKPDPTSEVAFPEPSEIPGEWESVRKYGEFIKFLNNAIEWENVLFFCYPYFWDLTQNWLFKRFLVHPDPDHRVFLRAGCARVVLTIRPGFETAFAGLVDYFTLPNHPVPSPQSQKTPYVTIGEEIRNYAMTNYGHIPPANPDGNVRALLHPLQIRIWKELQDIMRVLEAYNAKQHQAQPGLSPDVKVYPATLADPAFTSLVPLVEGGTVVVAALVLQDPWGRPYAYSSPGEHGEDYDLACYGKSGNHDVNGEGLDAWITSWAEGNVVSRWYEYTPTSALDVSVTVGQPQPKRF